MIKDKCRKIYDFDEDEWIEYNIQKNLTKKTINEYVQIKYNRAGKDEFFSGFVKNVKGDKISIKQKKQELTLKIPQIISLKVCIRNRNRLKWIQ